MFCPTLWKCTHNRILLSKLVLRYFIVNCHLLCTAVVDVLTKKFIYLSLLFPIVFNWCFQFQAWSLTEMKQASGLTIGAMFLSLSTPPPLMSPTPEPSMSSRSPPGSPCRSSTLTWREPTRASVTPHVTMGHLTPTLSALASPKVGVKTTLVSISSAARAG